MTGATATHEADTVVLAGGSWSGQVTVAGAPALPVRPVRGQLLHLPHGSALLSRIVVGDRCYAVPTADHGLLVGATAEDVGFDETATVAGVRELIEAVCEMIPSAWQAGFGEARVGLRPGTPDALPVIGPSAVVEGLIYATGHYRNGILFAPLTAALVSALAAGRRDDPALTAVAPSRFGAF